MAARARAGGFYLVQAGLKAYNTEKKMKIFE